MNWRNDMVLLQINLILLFLYTKHCGFVKINLSPEHLIYL
ncbi:unnamed protein product [Schistosoma curassoni]|uniref:Uncharacterized protein n=1 Tax=Schistosoma curassoni TaxID=6186 RepID=A0A183KJ60_9TREM|nr:unnamed protein product [Schistosoma curassoni]